MFKELIFVKKKLYFILTNDIYSCNIVIIIGVIYHDPCRQTLNVSDIDACVLIPQITSSLIKRTTKQAITRTIHLKI